MPEEEKPVQAKEFVTLHAGADSGWVRRSEKHAWDLAPPLLQRRVYNLRIERLK